MSKRSYRQNCALALGLDIIGERWTLLIIRGLLTGPKRYTELLDQMRGMGTNLLASRLKTLQEHQIIEQVNGDGSARYSLTERGEQLRPIIHSLIRWGHQFRGLVTEESISRPEWDMLAIEAAFRPERTAGINCIIDLSLDGFRFHIRIEDREVRCIEGANENADAVARTSTSILLEIGEGRYTVKQAVEGGKLDLSGSRRAFNLLFELFEL